MLVIAGDTPGAALTSNFRIDQHDLANSVGAIAETVYSAATAEADAARAYRRAALERRPVVLNLPIDLQAQPAVDAPPSRACCPCRRRPRRARRRSPPSPTCCRARSGRSSSPAVAPSSADAGPALAALGERAGALLANSAMAQGIFHGDPWALRISGGFASPVAAELLPQADVVLAFGAALNHWTTRHGELIGPQARVVQVDVEPRAIGANRRIDLAVVGDTGAVAEALEAELAARGHGATGYRTDEVGAQLAARRWRDEPYEPSTADGYVDPRDFSIALADLLPSRKTVAIDSGHFMGWPAMFLDVEDARHWVFMNGFQAVGLGLAGAIGAAAAEPGQITVAALGDGGLFFALQELDSAARAGARLLIVVYDDAAYGAEVHHFAPMGHATDTVSFPDADLAAAARAHGVDAITVRHVDDLAPVAEWVRSGTGPLLVDAKVDPIDLRRLAAGSVPRRLTTTTEEQHVVHVVQHHRRTARRAGRRLREGRRPHAAAERGHAGHRPARAVRQHAAALAPAPQPLRRRRSRLGVGRAGDRRAHRAPTSTPRSTGSAARTARTSPRSSRAGSSGRRSSSTSRPSAPRTPATC